MISDRSLRRMLGSDKRVAFWGDLVRAIAAAFLIIVVAACLIYYTALAKLMFTALHMNDFGKFYYSTRAFLAHGDMYAPSPATEIPVTETETRQFANMNPPHFHLLLLPVATMPPLAALIVWTVVSAAALGWSLHVIARELGLRRTWTGLVWTLFAVIVVGATGIIVVTGQVTFLLMLPLTLAWARARKGRWSSAGIWLGLLAGVKPFLGLFGVYLLLKGRYRAALFMIGSASAFVAVGVLVFGVANYQNWLRALSGVNWTWAVMNASIEGLLSRSFANPFTTSFIYAPEVVKPLTWGISLAVLMVSGIVLLRDKSDRRIDRAFALLLIVALLVSPLGWIYYIWLAAAPLWALYVSRTAGRSRARNVLLVIAAIGILSPLFVTFPWRSHRWWSITIGSVYTWTMLALWGAIILDWRASGRATTRA